MRYGGIGPGGKADKVLGQVSQSSYAFFNDEAGLAAEEEDIGQQAEEQPGTGGSGKLHTLHAEVDTEGIDRADDHQDHQSESGALRDAGYVLMAPARSGVARENVVAVPARSAKTAIRSISFPAIPSTLFPRTGRQAQNISVCPFADMKHEAEGCGQHQIKAQGIGPQ